MKSRAGIIYTRENGVSRKSKNTVFDDDIHRSTYATPIRADGEVSMLEKNSVYRDKNLFHNSHPEELHPEVEIADPSRTLEDIAVNSARTIYRIKTVFPFVIFKDEVIVDEEKVTVLIGNFYKSGYLRSIMLRDISNVSVDTSVLFARITIIDRNFVHDQLKIRYLKKHDAFTMRRIIMGLAIASANKVDLTQYTLKQLKEYTEEIGRSREMEDRTI